MRLRGRKLRRRAERVYNYHNLGVGIFPEGEEKTPTGSGERYNFDRMYMLVSSYDFTGKSVVDLGCNSGWFCFQAKLLGASETVGIDYGEFGIMGEAINYAKLVERRMKLGMTFIDQDLSTVDLKRVAADRGLERFDAAFLLSVLHHIPDQGAFFRHVYENTAEVIFYEDHEFWNELYDDSGEPIEVKGEGYRHGWNEDMSWQRKMGSLDRHQGAILDAYRDSWRRETLLLDRFSEIRLLGLSEKRRPMLGLFK